MTKSARSRKARRAEWEAAPGPWSDSEAEMLTATSYVPKKSSRNGALVATAAPNQHQPGVLCLPQDSRPHVEGCRTDLGIPVHAGEGEEDVQVRAGRYLQAAMEQIPHTDTQAMFS